MTTHAVTVVEWKDGLHQAFCSHLACPWNLTTTPQTDEERAWEEVDSHEPARDYVPDRPRPRTRVIEES